MPLFNRKRATDIRSINAKPEDEYLLVVFGYKPSWLESDGNKPVDELMVGPEDAQVRVRYLGNGTFETYRNQFDNPISISLINWETGLDKKDVTKLYPDILWEINLGISGNVHITELYRDRALVRYKKPIWQS